MGGFRCFGGHPGWCERCEHGQEASYWAGNVAGVLLNVLALLPQAQGRGSATADMVVLNEMRLGSKADARAALEGDLGIGAKGFFAGATGKSRDFKITQFANGNYRFEFFSPANNPGYRKVYIQEV